MTTSLGPRRGAGRGAKAGSFGSRLDSLSAAELDPCSDIITTRLPPRPPRPPRPPPRLWSDNIRDDGGDHTDKSRGDRTDKLPLKTLQALHAVEHLILEVLEVLKASMLATTVNMVIIAR